MGSAAPGDRHAQFASDVWWNVAGLAVAGCLGIVLNYLVSAIYGTAALGVFNQVFAVYILFSHLAALGFHYSVLRHLAAAADARERRAVTTSALIATSATASLFAGILWLAAGPAGRALGSGDVSVGLRCAAPGILFFALSKVTLGCLNALQRMRWYAVLYGGRFLFMMVAFAGCTALGIGHAALPVILSASELATFLLSLVPIAPLLGRIDRAELARWVPEHVRFGLKGFMSGLLAVLNTRIDVLILGYFSTDRVVGAYSFAAILAEGLYQLLIVLRTNFAPVLVRLCTEGRTAELVDLVRRARNRTYLGSIASGALAIAGYALFVRWGTSDPTVADSWIYFAVLIAGMVGSAGYAPFQPILLYAGLPGWHAVLMVGLVAFNAVVNAVLIACLGAIGAALGSAATFLFGVLLLRVSSARLLGVRL
jgi:O-antigen/teichoic acid export membrane protein